GQVHGRHRDRRPRHGRGDRASQGQGLRPRQAVGGARPRHVRRAPAGRPQADVMRERDTIAWWAWGAWSLGAGADLGSFVWALSVLPGRVAARVGLDGVDRWGSITDHVVMSVIVGVVFLPTPWFFLMTATPPGTWLNVPYKGYWLASPER